MHHARRRHLLSLRYRPAAWQRAEDQLFDRSGLDLFYQLCLAKEGYGTRAEAFAQFEESCQELLARMSEARPAEGAILVKRWTEWVREYRARVRSR